MLAILFKKLQKSLAKGGSSHSNTTPATLSHLLYRSAGTLAALSHLLYRFAEMLATLSPDLPELWPHSLICCTDLQELLPHSVQICQNSCCTLSLLYRFAGTL